MSRRRRSDATRRSGVDVGNPHAVSFVDDPTELAALPLWTAPDWSPAEAFPAGVNQEFVAILGERHIAMRVYERGFRRDPILRHRYGRGGRGCRTPAPDRLPVRSGHSGYSGASR